MPNGHVVLVNVSYHNSVKVLDSKGIKHGTDDRIGSYIAFCKGIGLGEQVALPELSRANSDTQEITAGQQVTVTIPDGAGAQEVAKILFENKIIATKSEFLNQVKRQDAEQKIKSGIYVITTGTTPADIVHLLISGLSARADFVKANITSEAAPSATKSAPGTEVVS